MNELLIKAKDVSKQFKIKSHQGKKVIQAVNNVNFELYEGDTIGLVGESGCGKSTLGRCLLNLFPITGGEIYFRSERFDQYKFKKMLPLRREMQIIFQDPCTSMNPRMRVNQLVRAPLDAFRMGSESEREDLVAKILSDVGLGEEYLYKYPHEMSGGQRQRVAIARAMVSRPSFVVCDEPTSALDVSVRSQVLNLMRDLQRETNVSYLFISHDLGTVNHLCDKVIVMYLGCIVEVADCDSLFADPLHPYVKALLSAIPIPDVTVKRERIILQGDVPSLINPPTGCGFHPRCRYTLPICREYVPELQDIGNNHKVACHLCNTPEANYC
ncbi:MAG: ABC transporter ATP-binding protein [Anaerolineales bacterium]|nr:ABC transporter ATP-binding protein [Anaerolineales bacterium]